VEVQDFCITASMLPISAGDSLDAGILRRSFTNFLRKTLMVSFMIEMSRLSITDPFQINHCQAMGATGFTHELICYCGFDFG
jgi:hypothetical protein